MSRAALNQALAEYPWGMREQVRGYVDAVQDALPSIFREARVEYRRDLVDQAIFLIGVRKLWTLVDGQFSILRRSLDAMSDQGVPSVRFGGTAYQRGNANYRAVRDLREDLRLLLIRLEVFDLVNRSLTELVESIGEGERGGR